MKSLQMFLLAADKLIRCRWDGRSERLDVVNTALEGETLREVAQDPANPQRPIHPEEDANTICVAYTDGSVYASHDAGESWRQLEVSPSKLYGVRLMSAL